MIITDKEQLKQKCKPCKSTEEGEEIGAKLLKELTKNLLICPSSEMIDKLGVYSEVGIDAIIISSGFGQSQQDLTESMHRIHDEVMPYFKNTGSKVA